MKHDVIEKNVGLLGILVSVAGVIVLLVAG